MWLLQRLASTVEGPLRPRSQKAACSFTHGVRRGEIMEYPTVPFIILLVSMGLPLAVMATEHHRQLIKKLLTDAGYERDVRPVIDAATATDVTIRMNLGQIRDMMEKEQVLITLVWLAFRWRDEFMTWNSSDYGGVAKIHVQSSRIWRPDIILYTSVDDSRTSVNLFSETNAIVSADGSVFWVTSALLKSSCKVDIAHYPFDEQRCVFHFGSWTYTESELNLTCEQDRVNTDNMVLNGEWTLMGAPCHQQVNHYPCCEEPFADVRFTLDIKRLPMFYLYNLLFPAVCLFLVGSLVFLVPPDSGEKVSLGVTVLLAMTVFMLIIMENIPATSEVVPWLDKFTGAATGLLSLSTIMSILVVNCHYQGTKGRPPPPWVQRHILGSARRLFCMKENPSDANNCHYQSEKLLTQRPDNNMHDITTVDRVEYNSLTDVTRKLDAILREMQMSKCSRQETESVQGQWSEVAQVLDRFFLIIFILLVSAVTIFVFSLVVFN